MYYITPLQNLMYMVYFRISFILTEQSTAMAYHGGWRVSLWWAGRAGRRSAGS